MYLSEETFRKNGVKADIHWYSTVGVMFPNCLKFSDKLNEIRLQKGITTHFFHDLYRIDKDQRKAYYRDTKNGNADVIVDYDFMHIVPPMNAPDFLKPIAAANGYVDVLSTRFIRANKLIHGDWVLPFVTHAVVEIDAEDDFAFLEYQLARNSSIYTQLFD